LIAGDPDDVETTANHMASRSRNGRASFPEDIAAAAIFLASEEAWYVNGSCLVIDGAGEALGDKASRYFGSPMSLVGPAARRIGTEV
jgi:NAD(P)-dependent dehydrogenase (short-subunit alcohol dehydrogenase family)